MTASVCKKFTIEARKKCSANRCPPPTVVPGMLIPKAAAARKTAERVTGFRSAGGQQGLDQQIMSRENARDASDSGLHPKAKVRAVLYYPISTGRNFQEILRLLVALQTADKFAVATPADWQPGDDVIVPHPGSCGSAQERVAGKQAGMKCLDWFLCLKELPKNQLDLPPAWK